MPDTLRYVERKLVTERLTLEPLTLAHVEPLVAALRDPALYEWVGETIPDSAALRARFVRVSNPYAPNGDLWLNWAMRLTGQGALVGVVEATIFAAREANLAYFVDLQHQRCGYGREACAAVIGTVFATYDVTRIIATMDTRNVASQRLASTLGFVRLAEPEEITPFRGAPAWDYRYVLERPAAAMRSS